MKVYKLTSAAVTTHGGYQWAPGEWRESPGTGDLCSNGWLHWYSDPLLGVFLDPIHAAFGATARLWEAEAGGKMLDDRGLKGGSTHLRLVREIPLPVVSMEQRVRFGLYCAQARIGDRCPEWSAWADRWLSGEDRSGEAAAAVAAVAAAAAARAARAAARAASAAARASEAAAWASEAAARAAAWTAEEAAAAGPPLDLPAIARRAVEP